MSNRRHQFDVRNSLRPLITIAVCLLEAGRSEAAKKKKLPDNPPGMFSFPAAVVPGAETEIKFYTTPLGKPTGLWTNFPAQILPSKFAAQDPDANRYLVKVPADVPVGIYAVRVGTTEGISDLQLLMVDDLRNTKRGGQNTSVPSAQPITLPIAIDGACESLASDYYRFHAEKGQRVSFEVVAQRLGSRLDPVVRILDAAGHELSYVDDTPGLGSDCRFGVTFAQAGDYVIELHDAEYMGGNDHRYRLRVGGFPTGTVAFPLGAKRRASSTFTLQDPSEYGHPSSQFTGVAADGPMARLQFGNRDQGSTFVTVLVGEQDEMIADGPHASRETAISIPIPAAISGRFDGPTSHRNFYRFDGLKGQRLSIRGRTRSASSACNLTLEILKPDGTRLVESKPAGSDDGLLDVTLPDDGKYLLVAGELTGSYGSAMVYRLEVERYKPGYSLGLDVLKVDAAIGGTFTLKVKCERSGYDGPINLSLDGDAKAFAIKGGLLAKSAKETEIEVTVPAGTVTAAPLSFRVIGRATIEGTEPAAIASTSSQLAIIFPRLLFPPADIDGVVGLRVRPVGE